MAKAKSKKTQAVEEKHKSRWGDVVDGQKQYDLHSGQSQIMKSNKRFTAAVAGTGGGKTVLGPLWFAKRVKEMVAKGKTTGLKGMVIAPTYKVLSRATAPTLVDTFRDTPLEGRYLESKGQYIFPNNLGILYLLSADSPNGLEGGQLDLGAWLDEAGQMTYSAWLAILRRTGVNQAPVLITTTPYLNNWLKTKVLDLYLKGDKDYMVVTWASISNPTYPKDEYDRAKRSMPKSMFDMMYNGLFTSMEGLVYPSFHLCIRDPNDFHDVDGRALGGIDFGWRAPFCALQGKLFVQDGRDVLYIHAERYKNKCKIAEHVKYMDKSAIWYADPSDPESIKDLRDEGLRVVPAINDVDFGIRQVNERINSARLFVSTSCEALITEAGGYMYPDCEEGKEQEKPIDGMDHAMDALRYLSASIARKRPRYRERQSVIIRRMG